MHFDDSLRGERGREKSGVRCTPLRSQHASILVLIPKNHSVGGNEGKIDSKTFLKVTHPRIVDKVLGVVVDVADATPAALLHHQQVQATIQVIVRAVNLLVE